MSPGAGGRVKARGKGVNGVAVPSVTEKEEGLGPSAANGEPVSLLARPLGVEGWSALEPVLLAALASSEPLLLVGRHGAAKSFLIERLAEALELEFRCYNASLIDYDDLVGIPVPDERGEGLRYISTATSIWGAEVVFVDEISRTRPDLANKLFPIIHERRVQGVRLERLRYRWAAMNPPASAEEDDSPGEVYLGAEPLDPALADRFGFLVEVPDWDQLTEREQTAILLDQFRGRRAAPVEIPALVLAAERAYRALKEDPPSRLADYFRTLASVRTAAGQTPFSARRLCTLMRTALAVQAARIALARLADPSARAESVDWETSVWLAVKHGDPTLASTGRIDRAAQLAQHRRSWQLSGLDADDPWRELLTQNDPLERLVRALELGARIEDDELTPLVLDAVASVENPGLRTAVALAVYLAVHRRSGVHATVIETLALEVRRVLQPRKRKLAVSTHALGPVREVGALTAALDEREDSPTGLRDRYTRNLLEGLLPDGYAGCSPTAVRDRFWSLWERLSVDAVFAEGAPR